jgi:hypothetical protein
MQTKRRNFLQMLSLSPLAFLLPKADARPRSDVTAKTRRLVGERAWEEKPRVIDLGYRGFTLLWSGWIGHIDHPCYYGHWIGVNKETDTLVYASYPGKEGKFQRGCNFEITMVHPQIDITIETPEHVKEQARMECLYRLRRVIDDLAQESPTSDFEKNYYFHPQRTR